MFKCLISPRPGDNFWKGFCSSTSAMNCMQESCPSTGHKMFCAGPNFLSQTKIDLHIVPVPIFWPGKKGWDRHNMQFNFCLAQKIWTGWKRFGTFRRRQLWLVWILHYFEFCSATLLDKIENSAKSAPVKAYALDCNTFRNRLDWKNKTHIF